MGIHRTVAVTFWSRVKTRGAACTRGVHTRCPPRVVRRHAENCIMQARDGENVARRFFYFSSPATACKFHEPRVGFVRIVRVALHDSGATLFSPSCLSSLPPVYFARFANIASRRRANLRMYTPKIGNIALFIIGRMMYQSLYLTETALYRFFRGKLDTVADARHK